MTRAKRPDIVTRANNNLPFSSFIFVLPFRNRFQMEKYGPGTTELMGTQPIFNASTLLGAYDLKKVRSLSNFYRLMPGRRGINFCQRLPLNTTHEKAPSRTRRRRRSCICSPVREYQRVKERKKTQTHTHKKKITNIVDGDDLFPCRWRPNRNGTAGRVTLRAKPRR